MNDLDIDLSSLKIPNHVAIIMDGNGRWAKNRHKPRTFGHIKGAEVLEQTLEDCDTLGIRYLTVYAFSTENWARPMEEVQFIMDLLKKYLIKSMSKCMKNNVRCCIIGERSKLNKDVLEAAMQLEEATKDNTGITLVIAVNYGGRDELLRGFRKLSQKIENGELTSAQITEEDINSCLDTADFPDPDLLIRTSGEERLSNFLPWQLAYSEFYFTKTLWPDFNMQELLKAIEAYTSRDRRYGKIKG